MNHSGPAVKVVLLGNSGAGKSSIAHRFVYDKFNHYPESTIGASFFTRFMKKKDSTSTIKYHIWDTAGQEKYHALAPMYYRGAAAAVLVYDIVSIVSFEALKSWLQRLREFGPMGLALIIVGNKCDLDDKRQISKETAEAFAKQEGCLYLETSARDDTNVELVFQEIARLLPKSSEEENGDDVPPQDVLDLVPSSSTSYCTC